MITRLLVRCPYWALAWVVVSLKKTVNANFQPDTLRGVEDKHKCLFHNGIYWQKKIKQSNKKQTDMALPISPKVNLGYNFPMVNVYDVVQRDSRIKRYYKLTTTSK